MPAAEKLYTLSREALLSKFQTNSSGLTDQEAEKRLGIFGLNHLTVKKRVSPLSIFLEQFQSSLILILIGAAVLVFFVWYFGERDQSDLIEGGLILAIVLMITVLGFFQEYKAEKAIEALKKLLAFKAKVLRGGREIEIDVTRLVPGDLVILEEGEKVPADIRLIEVSSLNTLEASLTGESTPVSKDEGTLGGNLEIADQKNMVFSGTSVTSGRGLGIVVQTGDKTEIGKIASSVAEVEEEKTPIQKRLDEIGRTLGYAVLGIAGVVFVFIVFFASETSSLPWLEKLIHSFVAAIALAVAAIPEGLPAVVTISLALGTQRMLKRNALVRKLSSIETLGSTDVICSDKTGTLTKGEMTVKEIFFDAASYKLSGVGYDTSGEFTLSGKKTDPKNLQPILEAGLFCNNSVLERDKIIGDPTEGALLVSAQKAGLSLKAQRTKEIPFTSDRKMMSVQIKKDGSYLVFAKGAPEILLEHCTQIIRDGKESLLTEKDKKNILEQTLSMSNRALRTLGFAYKKSALTEKNFESDLVFLGLQGMIDPPRTEVKPLIEQCNNSGIRIIMITGDHEATAKAVAADIGIKGESKSGAELNTLSDTQLDKIIQEVNIYARVSPSFKMKIIESLKRHGHIVAMTGDGVNDAPAVKKADIGIAMGITGTDVAKEASDLVLLDDNFSTIVAAIEEGRGIFVNIRKFVDYLLSCNIAEVLVVFFAVIFLQHQPLTATMLLWINVITDGLPAVALGLDPAEKGIMRYNPKRFQEEIINKKLWLEMMIFGVLLTIGVLGIYILNLKEGAAEARAAAFLAIVFFELVRLLIIRSDNKTPLFSNTWLIVAVVASFLMQIAIVYIPFLANLFEIKHIDWYDWVYIGVVCVLIWVGFEVIRRLAGISNLLETPELKTGSSKRLT